MELLVREIIADDIQHLINYWTGSNEAYMRQMGVEISLLPSKEEWQTMLNKQLTQNYPEKESYCTIWTLDEKPFGHSNVDKIVFGEEAFLHLHIWHENNRSKGYGRQLLPH